MDDWLSVAQYAVHRRGAMQKPRELAALLAILGEREIRHVLEIGGMFGGTAWAFQHIKRNDGKYVCVDNFTLEGRLEHAPPQHILIRGDSTDPATVRQPRLQGLCFDFIFIDGDHRYDAAWADYYNWSMLLAVGGVIAFHDICHRRMIGHDMWRFWNEVRARSASASLEVYDPSEAWGGIGVLLARLPDKLPSYCLPGGMLAMPDQCAFAACEQCSAVLEPHEEIYCTGCAAERNP